MSKVTRFVYVPLSKNLEFQSLIEDNKKLVPCSLYVDKEEQKIYFVEQETGPIMDGNIFDISLYDTDTCINDSIGMRIGSSVGL